METAKFSVWIWGFSGIQHLSKSLNSFIADQIIKKKHQTTELWSKRIVGKEFQQTTDSPSYLKRFNVFTILREQPRMWEAQCIFPISYFISSLIFQISRIQYISSHLHSVLFSTSWMSKRRIATFIIIDMANAHYEVYVQLHFPCFNNFPCARVILMIGGCHFYKGVQLWRKRIARLFLQWSYQRYPCGDDSLCYYHFSHTFSTKSLGALWSWWRRAMDVHHIIQEKEALGESLSFLSAKAHNSRLIPSFK